MEFLNTPTTEDSDMAKVREIFERALSAIVASTQLAKEVQELRGSVDSLRSEIDSVRAYNQRLDVELTETRNQRDQALRDKAAAIDELNAAKAQLANAEYSKSALQSAHDSLSEQHQNLKREHDDVQLENMQLADEVKDLKAKLEKVKAVFGIQPRDVTTGQWESPKVVDEPAPTQEGTEQPRAGTDSYWR